MKILAAARHKFFRNYPLLYDDQSFTEYKFYKMFEYHPDLKNPQTFNEKINYKKLNDRNPLLILISDKIAVRTYVKRIIGSKYLPAVLRIFRYKNEISFDDLPNQFLIKATHGCSWLKIVRDRKKEDLNQLRSICAEWLEKNYFYKGREWSYKHVQPGIIVEELLLDNGKIPTDYKFYCFHGKVKMIQADYDRFTNHVLNRYDEFGNILDVKFKYNINRNKVKLTIDLPAMKKIAEKLSEDFDFIRVDLYSVNGKIYFGELTNYPAMGYQACFPHDFDLKMGSYLNIQDY